MTLSMQPRWIVPAKFNFSKGGVSGGLLIIGAHGEPSCFAIRLADGTVAWRRETGTSIKGPVVVDGSTAYCAGTYLLEPGVRNIRRSAIHAIDAVNGAVRWRTDINGWCQDEIAQRDGTLVLYTLTDVRLPGGGYDVDCAIFVIDKLNGSVLQTIAIGQGRPRLFEFHHDRLLVVRDRGVDAYHPRTWIADRLFTSSESIWVGSLRDDRCYLVTGATNRSGPSTLLAVSTAAWTILWSRSFTDSCQDVATDGDRLAVTRSQGKQGVFSVDALDSGSGATLWTYTEGNRSGPVEFVRDRLLVQVRHRKPSRLHSQGTTITVGLDARDGARSFRLEHAFSAGWIADLGEVVVSSHVEYLLGLDLDRLWSRRFSGAAIRGAPAYDRGLIVSGDSAGKVIAVDYETGDVQWETALPRPVESDCAIKYQRVFIGHAGGLACLDLASGRVIWDHRLDRAVTSAVGAFNHEIVFGARDGSIRAVAPADGALVWQFQTQGYVEGGVAFDGTGYYAGSADGNLYALDLEGHERWRFATTDEISSTPLISGELVVVGNGGGLLAALDRANGQVRWTHQLGDSLKHSSAVSVPGTLCIGDESGRVRRISLPDGNIEWTSAPIGAIRATPVWSRAELFVGTMDGKVVVLDIRDGSIVRTVELSGPVFAPLLGHPEAVFVADEGGGLYALVH